MQSLGKCCRWILPQRIFEVPTLIAELFICHPTACCSKLGATCYRSCNCFTCFFDLVRTDSYSYINIAGIPFCNAGRECKNLLKLETFCRGTLTDKALSICCFCFHFNLSLNCCLVYFEGSSLGLWFLAYCSYYSGYLYHYRLVY